MLAGTLALKLLLFIAIGFAATKLKVVAGDFNKQFTKFLTSIILPCMIVNSMYGMKYSLEELKNCGYLLLLSLGFLLIEFIMAQIAFLITGREGSSRILRFGMIFTNFSFMGFPVVEALYGNQGIFYFAIFLIPIRIFYYSSAKPLLSPPAENPVKESALTVIKKTLNPSIVAVFVGVFFYITGIRLPDTIEYVMSSLAATCSPLGMMLCGITLGYYPLKKLLQPRYLRLTLVRNFFIPAIFYVLVRLVSLPYDLAQIVIICAALPVSTLMVAFCVQYDPDPEANFESAGSVFYSTLISIGTIPLWYNLASVL
ncbi:MAG: AEC family transporter [Oscillospiraceae bacterium]|nr:AEC family transporter [Oscillospiraceae bacterium]